VAVFDGVFGNPTASQVMAGAAAFRAHGADCVIGFGGGAALDVAKVVGLMAVHEGDVIEYVWDHPQVRPIVQPAAALRGAADHLGHRLRGGPLGGGRRERHATSSARCSAPRCWPARVRRPRAHAGAAPAVTAATGMDALTHNIESYLSPAYHPLCDGIALEGLRIGARALATAVSEPGNLQARSDMMMASMMGAIAFQKDLGSVHACAHALGAVCDLHHGLANALMIDTVLAWNHEAVPAQV
jgi:alcohol dehydrogenase class IV